jgi:threonine dehydrogenase-like Zn-dependent dehydrogenase
MSGVDSFIHFMIPPSVKPLGIMKPSLHHDCHCSIKWIGRSAAKGGHADVVIDCAGAKLSSNQGLYMLKPADGRLVLVPLFEQQPELHVNDAALFLNRSK